MIIPWIVIFILIFINAFYVAAEFASVSVRKSAVQQLAQEGNNSARGLLPILQNTERLDRYIATCQIGITLSSLILGAYGQATLAIEWAPLFARYGDLQSAAAHSVAALAVLILLTILQVLFGELVPKSLALQFPSRAALLMYLPMRWSLVLFSWFNTILNGSGNIVLKLLGSQHPTHRHIHSPEEIELLIAESRDGGLLEEDEHRRLHKALRLAKRAAHELMVPRPLICAIDIKTPIDRAVGIVTNSPFTRIPVYRESIDNIIGIIHTKDVVMSYLKHGHNASVQGLLRSVISVPEMVTSDRLLALMKEKHTQQAIVVDEFGTTTGLICLEDLLEEMLGDVKDELKNDEQTPEWLPDGRVRLPGLMRVDKASEFIGIAWNGSADTLGGQVIEALGRFPAEGEKSIIDGCEVEIERIVENRIGSLLIRPLRPKEGQVDA